MAFSPNNTIEFLAAYQGAMAGLSASGRPITSPDPDTYAPDANAAYAFAVEFDDQWGNVTPDAYQVPAIFLACQGYWAGRETAALEPSQFSVTVAAIIASIQAGSAKLAAEGVSVPAWGGGGGGGTDAHSFWAVPIQAPAPTPAQSDVYVYDTSTSQYALRQLTQDDILPGFAINSFTGGSTVETGATVTNPAFAASYNETPDSANITNTDGTDSPLALTTPFTAGTVVGAFHKTTPQAVTFTLHATKGSVTKTAASAINFFDRTFSGVGAAGAATATAAGTTAVLNGGAGTLAGSGSDGGLFNSIVGQTFGAFNPTNQKIYVLTPHTTVPHTFHDQDGFGFPMNAPTTFNFTNAQGAVLSYDLYESTNLLSAPFSLTVES